MPETTQNTILVVDDSRTILFIIKETLETNDYAVLAASNGPAALSIAADKNPDLILLDVMMPDMDGFEVCARLKADPRTRQIPVVFITASGKKEHEVRGLELGAEDFVHKPIHEAVLLARVGQILRRLQAEEQLRKSKESHRILLDNIQTQVWHLADEHTYGAVNKAHADYHGFTPKEIARRDMYEFLPGNVVDMLRQGNREVFSTGRQVRTEEWVPDASGEQRLLSITKTPKMNEWGDVEYVVCSAEDITERWKAEEALHESEELFRTLIEAMAEGIVLKDASDRYVHWNQTASEIFGIGIDELKGQTTERFKRQIVREDGSVFHKDDLPSLHTLRTGEPCKDVVMGILRSHQDTIWIKTNTRPYMKPRDGKLAGVIISFADITEQKRIETELLVNKLAIDSSINALAMADMDGNLTYVNQAFLDLWGYKGPDEVYGRQATMFWETEKYPAEVIDALRTQGAWQGEMTARRRDGSLFDAQLSAGMVFDGKGKPLCMQATFVDITERKKAENEILQVNQELQKTNAEKDKLFTIIAHDLKVPMSGLVASTEMLASQMDIFSENEIRLLSTELHKNARNTFELLEDLLQWARMSQGGIDYAPTQCNLKELVNMGLNSALNEAKRKDIAISSDIPHALTVLADQPMIKTVVRNVLFNAIKFTPRRGEIVITARQSEQMATVSVQDNGLGMNEQVLSSIFTLEKEKRQLGTEGEKGTGLGLVLCKQFIEQHSGQIWAESEPGQGTTVFFTLPAA